MFAMLLLALLPAEPPRPFAVHVVDRDTGRGVPLIELRSVNDVRLVTDSQGYAAILEPDWMGREIYFHIRGHGYEVPKDGFNYRGERIRVTPGGEVRVTMQRTQIAERIYRVTGAGLYRDSVLLGKPAPIEQPLWNAEVFGCDSVLNAVHKGRLFWFWGDTNRASYPLGNFHASGAVSQLREIGGVPPERGVNLRYFADAKGFARPMAQMPGKGPTWLTAVASLPDRAGQPQLLAAYAKIEPPLDVYARGFARWDEGRELFTHHSDLPAQTPIPPEGHPLPLTEADAIAFANPWPRVRVRALAEAFLNPTAYESFTCLEPGSTLKNPKLDRDESGALRYAWRAHTPAVDFATESRWIQEGRIQERERRWLLRDRDTGAIVQAHSGSVAWNPFRQRWVMVTVQVMGTSYLGEVWYAEADTPQGPWNWAVKVATHDRTSYYNPKQHPYFEGAEGRRILFEGTFTRTFSGSDDATARYEYNQVMHRLDLEDPRTFLPVAIYREPNSEKSAGLSVGPRREGTVAFFACDRRAPRTVPILATPEGLRIGPKDSPNPLFHAVPMNASPAVPGTTPLFEYRSAAKNARFYSVHASLTLPGYERNPNPICRVWNSPAWVADRDRPPTEKP